MKNHFLSIGKVSEIFGVTTETIRNWDKEGIIDVVRTPKGHRRISMSEIKRILKNDKKPNAK